LVGERERCGGVGAATAQTGCHGNPLLDARAPACAGLRREQFERAPHERVSGKAVDAQLVRILDLDAIGEIDALQNGHDLVVAVVALWADDEREVNLRARRRALHARAFASSTNSRGSSASARVSTCRPTERNASSAFWRVATPLKASEVGRVFRRCAKPASTTRSS